MYVMDYEEGTLTNQLEKILEFFDCGAPSLC